jgi:LEA14-like dessication related protein
MRVRLTAFRPADFDLQLKGWRPFAVLFGLLLPLCLQACTQTAAILEADRKPTAMVRTLKVRSLSSQAINLIIDVQVDNPFSVPLPVEHAQYTLRSGDQTLFEGDSAVDLAIPPGRSRLVPIKLALPVEQVLASLPAASAGSVVPYVASLSITVRTPSDPVEITLQQAGALPIPALPQVELVQVDWQKLTLTDASAVLRLRVKSMNKFDLQLSQFSYTLVLAGWEVAHGKLSQNIIFSAEKSEESVEIAVPVSFSPLAAGSAFHQAMHDPLAPYRITGLIEARTSFGAMKLPFDRQGQANLRQAATLLRELAPQGESQ